jgi:tRNA(Ile)-lysidine synthase
MSAEPTFLSAVSDFLDRHCLLDGVGCAVVGVSGGVDSMVCLDVLRRRGVDVVAAHVNYGLRPAADDDEALVRTWCDRQDPPLPLRVRTADPTAEAEAGASLQAVARRQRYRFFRAVAREVGADAVAVGHHRDDQAETLLLHLLRGAGPEGLSGMPPSRPVHGVPELRLLRPLLSRRRSEIEAYAEAAGIPWCVDTTNESTDYRRGWIRTQVLPLLEAEVEGATDAIARSADLMRAYVDETVAPALRQRFDAAHISDAGPGLLLDLATLRAEPPVWRHRLLLEALRQTLPNAPQKKAVAEEIAALVDAQVGRRVDLAGGSVWRERPGLRFLPAAERPDPVPATPLAPQTAVATPDGDLTLAVTPDRPPAVRTADPTVAVADADRIAGSLAVRSWTAGDRFRPLGLEGTMLVSDLLTDAKVAPHRRLAACVVVDDDGIAWVVGHRLAHRVRVRPSTQRYAVLRLDP